MTKSLLYSVLSVFLCIAQPNIACWAADNDDFTEENSPQDSTKDSLPDSSDDDDINDILEDDQEEGSVLHTLFEHKGKVSVIPLLAAAGIYTTYFPSAEDGTTDKDDSSKGSAAERKNELKDKNGDQLPQRDIQPPHGAPTPLPLPPDQNPPKSAPPSQPTVAHYIPDTDSNIDQKINTYVTTEELCTRLRARNFSQNFVNKIVSGKDFSYEETVFSFDQNKSRLYQKIHHNSSYRFVLLIPQNTDTPIQTFIELAPKAAMLPRDIANAIYEHFKVPTTSRPRAGIPIKDGKAAMFENIAELSVTSWRVYGPSQQCIGSITPTIGCRIDNILPICDGIQVKPTASAS